MTTVYSKHNGDSLTEILGCCWTPNQTWRSPAPIYFSPTPPPSPPPTFPSWNAEGQSKTTPIVGASYSPPITPTPTAYIYAPVEIQGMKGILQYSVSPQNSFYQQQCLPPKTTPLMTSPHFISPPTSPHSSPIYFCNGNVQEFSPPTPPSPIHFKTTLLQVEPKPVASRIVTRLFSTTGPKQVQRSWSRQKGCCSFCKKNGESLKFYLSHNLKNANGSVIECPVLRKYVCPICRATGDSAHTLKYCPKNLFTNT